MSARRLRALFRRVVQEIRRDRPSLGLLFVAPIVITGLVTFILREGQTPAVTAEIVNEAGAPGAAVAGALRAALESRDVTVLDAADEAAARAAIVDGGASVAIVLPAEPRLGVALHPHHHQRPRPVRGRGAARRSSPRR